MNYASSPCCYFYLILNNIKALLVKVVKKFLTFHSISRVVDVFASTCNSSAPSVQRNRSQIHTLFPFVYPPIHSYGSKRVACFQFPIRILYPHLTSQRNGLNITGMFCRTATIPHLELPTSFHLMALLKLSSLGPCV